MAPQPPANQYVSVLIGERIVAMCWTDAHLRLVSAPTPGKIEAMTRFAGGAGSFCST